MENLLIKIGSNETLMRDAMSVREQVFQIEQGIARGLDFDGKDFRASHLVAYSSGQAVGCARIRQIGEKVKLERIALLEAYRGSGFGKEIVIRLIDYSKILPVNEIYFDAQAYLKGFYEKLGFTTRGKIFQEANIPHIEMFMKII